MFNFRVAFKSPFLIFYIMPFPILPIAVAAGTTLFSKLFGGSKAKSSDVNTTKNPNNFDYSSLLASLGSSMFSKIFSSSIDNSYSKDLMRYQGQLQLGNQSKLNAMLYPQQVASMRMAGLNPALMSSPMSPSAPMPSSTQSSSEINALGAASVLSQLSLNKSVENVNNEQANLLREEAQNKSFYNDTFFDNYAYEKAEQVSRTKLNRANFDMAYQNIKNLQKQIDLLDKNINNAIKEGKKLDEEIKTIMPIAKAQISEMYSRVKLNNKYMDEIDQAIEESGSRVAINGQEVKLKGLVIRLTRVQADIMEEYGADSMQAQIAGQYINSIANLIGSGASAASSIRGGKGTTIINKMPPVPQF